MRPQAGHTHHALVSGRDRVGLPGLTCALWLDCSESNSLAHTPGLWETQHFTLLGHHRHPVTGTQKTVAN